MPSPSSGAPPSTCAPSPVSERPRPAPPSAAPARTRTTSSPSCARSPDGSGLRLGGGAHRRRAPPVLHPVLGQCDRVLVLVDPGPVGMVQLVQREAGVERVVEA